MLDFELSRFEAIHARIKEKKHILLSQEELIQTLAKEVRNQQAIGGDKDQARVLLIELAEKDLERDSLLSKKGKHLPAITRNQEYIDQMSALQEEEADLLAKQEAIQREINMVDRPSTAMQQQDFQISDRGRDNWKQEKGQKILQLKQMESKSFHLAREVKHRARQHAQEVASIKYQL